MTYKDVIDRFKSVADAHYMLKDFGYGNLSDIKVHSQEGEADYPYLFLNPSTHTRNGVNMVYNFNMIVMDVATDEDDALSNYTAIQSKCQQYIDDVIAELYYGYSDKPEIQYTNVTYTPFKERFQDTVAGMTATISILVPTPINQCIAPIAPLVPPLVPPTGEHVLDTYTEIDYIIQPDTQQDPMRWQNTVLDTFNGIRPDALANYYTITQDGTWSFVLMGTVKRLTENGTWPDSPNIYWQNGLDIEPDITNWPVNAVVGEEYPFECRWIDVPLTTANGFGQWRCTDEPFPEDQGLILPGANLKGYYTA